MSEIILQFWQNKSKIISQFLEYQEHMALIFSFHPLLFAARALTVVHDCHPTPCLSSSPALFSVVLGWPGHVLLSGLYSSAVTQCSPVIFHPLWFVLKLWQLPMTTTQLHAFLPQLFSFVLFWDVLILFSCLACTLMLTQCSSLTFSPLWFAEHRALIVAHDCHRTSCLSSSLVLLRVVLGCFDLGLLSGLHSNTVTQCSSLTFLVIIYVQTNSIFNVNPRITFYSCRFLSVSYQNTRGCLVTFPCTEKKV